jgi:hypothetical protein
MSNWMYVLRNASEFLRSVVEIISFQPKLQLIIPTNPSQILFASDSQLDPAIRGSCGNVFPQITRMSVSSL